VISVVTPPDSAAGSSRGLIAWTWLSTAPGVAMSPYAGIGAVCGPMSSSIRSLIARFPARPTPTSAAVLDADVGLDDADRRVDDDRARDDDVELRRARAARLGHPAAEVLRVAPLRLVAGRLAVLRDADPEVAVGEADPVAGRRAVAGEALLRGEAAHASPP
jgi:hypothetical protein